MLGELEETGRRLLLYISRHCLLHFLVAGSIPDGVIGIFHLHNLSDRTMVLGSTEPLAKMSSTSISWG